MAQKISSFKIDNIMSNIHSSNSTKFKKSIVYIMLIMFFIINFSTTVNGQTTTTHENDVTIGQNIQSYRITKDTKDNQLESIKKHLLDKGVTIAFQKLERNDQKEITAIQIEYRSQKDSGQFFVNSGAPIKDIAILYHMAEDSVSISQDIKNLSQSFRIVKDEMEPQPSQSNKGVVVYAKDDVNDPTKKVTVIGKDGNKHNITPDKNTYILKTDSGKIKNESNSASFVKETKNDTVWIDQNVKNIVWTDEDGNDVEIIATEKDDKRIKIFTSQNDQPLLILDGVEISKEVMKNLDPNMIESVNVLKGENSIRIYGNKGKNGAIVITSKKESHTSGTDVEKTNKENTLSTNSNTKTVITQKSTSDNDFKEFIIHKNSEDEILESHKTYFKSEGVTFNYSKLKRNQQNEIIRISIKLTTKTGKSKSASFTNDDGISKILMGIKDGNLILNSSDY